MREHCHNVGCLRDTWKIQKVLPDTGFGKSTVNATCYNYGCGMPRYPVPAIPERAFIFRDCVLFARNVVYASGYFTKRVQP